LDSNLSSSGEVHVLAFETGQVFAIQNPFVWVYRVSTDPMDDSKLYICGQMSDDKRDIITIAYDLKVRKLLGVVEVEGESVYKPCVYDSRLIAYAIRNGSDMDDRYLEWSDEFVINPMEGTRSPICVADNGDRVKVDSQTFHEKPAGLEQRCHWKMRSRWYCTKLQKEIDAAACLSCKWFDSAAPVRGDIDAVNSAHKIAAVKVDNLLGKRSVQNVVDRGLTPPTTISFIENPFFEAEVCRSGQFCSSCRSEDAGGVSFRGQVSARWGLQENFMCPYVLEGCEYRGNVLSVEEKTCCGGKVKTVTTYECGAEKHGGAVTIDDCMICDVRNLRLKSKSREVFVPISVSPWADPNRRLAR